MKRHSPPRRLLFVTNVLGWAGAETQLAHLAVGMAERGYDVTVAPLRGVRIDPRPLESLGIRIVSLDAANRLQRLRALPSLVRLARRADIVHCSTFDATLWGRLAALLARRPTVVTEHTPGREVQVATSGASRARLIAFHNRVLDPFTFSTVACARWQIPLLISERIRPHSIVHIPNGVPLHDIESRSKTGVTREKLGIPREAKIVLHAARLAPHKGQRTTLPTVARLRERLGDVRALIAGEGPERDALEQEAVVHQWDWAYILGRRDDVPALLGLADLAVMPSRAEAMPMVVIEAMALGVPIVATDVGDVRHVVETAEAGICVPVGDDDAFFAACLRLLSDDGLRERLSANARAGSRSYDALVMSDRYAALFEAALGDGDLSSVRALVGARSVGSVAT